MQCYNDGYKGGYSTLEKVHGQIYKGERWNWSILSLVSGAEA